MRIYGLFEELTKIVFRKSTRKVTVEPNSQTVGDSIINIPDMANTTQEVLLSSQAQTITNKTINGSSNTITNVSLTTGVTGILPGANGGTGVNNTGRTVTLGGNITTGGSVDIQGAFQTAGAFNTVLTSTAATSVTLPTTGTLATLNGVEAFQNKTIDGDLNTVQDLLVTSIKTVVGDANKVILRDGSGVPTSALLLNVNVDAAAAIARSKLAVGTADHVVINSGTGAFSSEAQLNPTRGGTGVDNTGKTITLGGNLVTSGANAVTLTTTGSTNVTLPTTGTLATLAGTENLSSKTLASPDVTTHIRLLNQAQLKLREGTGGGTNEISIQAPATLAGDYTLTMPPDDGNSGEALTTNGSGVLAWSAVATDALNQYNVKVGNASNVATAVNTDTTGDIQADSTNGLSVNQLVTINTTQITTKTIASGSTLTYPRMIVNTGHTWTVSSGAFLYVFDKLTINGDLIVNGDSVVTNMGLA